MGGARRGFSAEKRVQQGGAKKKPNAVALGFFERCVPQAERDVSFGSEVRFAREVCLGT